MKATVSASKIQGEVQAIASKSVAHRYLIAAALADKEVFVGCHSVSEDILATVNCLRAMGAGVIRKKDGFLVSPIDRKKIDNGLTHNQKITENISLLMNNKYRPMTSLRDVDRTYEIGIKFGGDSDEEE